MSKCIFGALVALALFPWCAWAEHAGESSQFYPKHYVTDRPAPVAKSSTRPALQTAPAQQVEKHAVRSLGLEGGTVEVLKDELKTEAKSLMDTAEAPGLKVKSFSAIVSTEKQEHFLQAMEQYNTALLSKNLQPGVLYLVGPPINPVDLFEAGNVMAPLLSRGGLPMAVLEMPKKYAVSASPTWIIETESGEILLEAVPSLEKYINARGEFVDPSKILPQHKAQSSSNER